MGRVFNIFGSAVMIEVGILLGFEGYFIVKNWALMVR